MAKYYLQCGSNRQIRSAASAQQAALSFMDLVLQAHLWIYDDPALTESDCRDHLMMEALLHLEPTIRVSQRGYDRQDAQLVGTPETIQQWHSLMVAVTRLLVDAGLGSRNVSSVASLTSHRTRLPRLPR